MDSILAYQAGDSFFHRLSAGNKFLIFILLTISGMLSFDLRYLVILTLVAVLALKISQIRWRQIALIVKFALLFALLNLLVIYLLAPQYGAQLYGSKHVLFGSGYFALTQEQLLYESIVLFKYLFSLPLALVFLLTTNPSQLAAGLNKIGVPYRVAYALNLTLRYLPNIQSNFIMQKQVAEARGYPLGKGTKIGARVKTVTRILSRLVFATLADINAISQAMELRRFGQLKKRSWYYQEKWQGRDLFSLIITILLILLNLTFCYWNGSQYWNPFV
ncbi:energy-coupling factor transporter transmembrane component T family protein [Eupransor demetentiae]|uniref:ECF-type transporter transmembrane protein EcfT (EcfT) n=1 Tax=Eupransor demetentiae TaxID=3109584 RepID=A0ABP0EPF3_9LACO|nr:ECF-type transporter transmembrane protein EcfT (EcfT) [Lactobacillaceae bacterium LMG 33000]